MFAVFIFGAGLATALKEYYERASFGRSEIYVKNVISPGTPPVSAPFQLAKLKFLKSSHFPVLFISLQ